MKTILNIVVLLVLCLITSIKVNGQYIINVNPIKKMVPADELALKKIIQALVNQPDVVVFEGYLVGGELYFDFEKLKSKELEDPYYQLHPDTFPTACSYVKSIVLYKQPKGYNIKPGDVINMCEPNLMRHQSFTNPKTKKFHRGSISSVYSANSKVGMEKAWYIGKIKKLDKKYMLNSPHKESYAFELIETINTIELDDYRCWYYFPNIDMHKLLLPMGDLSYIESFLNGKKKLYWYSRASFSDYYYHYDYNDDYNYDDNNVFIENAVNKSKEVWYCFINKDDFTKFIKSIRGLTKQTDPNYKAYKQLKVEQEQNERLAYPGRYLLDKKQRAYTDSLNQAFKKRCVNCGEQVSKKAKAKAAKNSISAALGTLTYGIQNQSKVTTAGVDNTKYHWARYKW